MASSVTSSGTLESGPVHSLLPARRQLVTIGTALAAGVAVAVTSGTDGLSSPPAAYVESWIDAMRPLRMDEGAQCARAHDGGAGRNGPAVRVSPRA